ncbi:hypothetical protein EJB05_41162 [Eragrostis curvula]|uniref:Non-specific lipid-transfer protein n=1 Tax=Eragrostis curvula TaxID=38414 RepID=A0A5J9T8Y5_9POAL|nr:hypothetical protein EJB05_41162 [Eragrostis curvula]
MKKISTFAVLLLAMLAAQELVAVQADIECSAVVQDLMPCLDYLEGDEGSPSGACCGGVNTLYEAAGTTEERQATCECLKAAYRQYNVIVSRAQALSNECGVGISFPITPNIDCSRIP